MTNITREIRLRLPLSLAERKCLMNTMNEYADACNCVSKYIYKHKILNQSELYKKLQPSITEEYKLSKSATKSIIKTVVEAYRTREKENKKRKKLKFSQKDRLLRWGNDYKIEEDKGYITTLNDKIRFEVVDFDKYFGLVLNYYFEPATISHGLTSSFLETSVKVNIGETTKTEEWWSKIVIWFMWHSMSRKLLKK